MNALILLIFNTLLILIFKIFKFNLILKSYYYIIIIYTFQVFMYIFGPIIMPINININTVLSIIIWEISLLFGCLSQIMINKYLYYYIEKNKLLIKINYLYINYIFYNILILISIVLYYKILINTIDKYSIFLIRSQSSVLTWNSEKRLAEIFYLLSWYFGFNFSLNKELKFLSIIFLIILSILKSLCFMSRAPVIEIVLLIIILIKNKNSNNNKYLYYFLLFVLSILILLIGVFRDLNHYSNIKYLDKYFNSYYELGLFKYFIAEIQLYLTNGISNLNDYVNNIGNIQSVGFLGLNKLNENISFGPSMFKYGGYNSRTIFIDLLSDGGMWFIFFIGYIYGMIIYFKFKEKNNIKYIFIFILSYSLIENAIYSNPLYIKLLIIDILSYNMFFKIKFSTNKFLYFKYKNKF